MFVLGFLAGVAVLWLTARVHNAVSNAKKMGTAPCGGHDDTMVQPLGGCYWHCVSNGFPFYGSTCTYYCYGGGGGGGIH